MWKAKFLIRDKNGLYESRAIKFDLILYAYSISYYIKGDDAYLITAVLMEGKENNKNRFLKDLKKDKFVEKVEVYGNFFTCKSRLGKVISFKKYGHVFFNPSIILIKPIIIFPNGEEEWEIASFEKKDINEIVKFATEKYEGELVYLKPEKIKDVKIFTIFPILTSKQKKAFDLAVKQGYYEYPKKINIEGLAKLMKISFSTYRAHLRKAEKKLLPFIAKRIY
jgi:predicted DNA binding protein